MTRSPGSRAVRLLLVLASLVAGLVAPSVAQSTPVIRQWREFLFGRIQEDGVEYFDFDVPAEAYRVIISFDRGALGEMEAPTMLLKYGAFPTGADYDQVLALNGSNDFFQMRVDNLRSGRYFLSLVGAKTYSSLKSFVGGADDLFYFVSVWYFGCTDPSFAGSRCLSPIIDGGAIVTPSTKSVTTYYPTQGLNTGCVDARRSSVYFTFEVDSSEWDLTLKLATSSESELTILAGANLRDPGDLEPGALVQSARIPAGQGDRSVVLRVTAPLIGKWMVLVKGRVTSQPSCADGGGAQFTLTASHERDCSQVADGQIQTRSGLPIINLCGLEITRLNEMRKNPFKSEQYLEAKFQADEPRVGNGDAPPEQTQPVVPYFFDLPKTYAGANVALTAYVTANVKSFQLLARLDGLPTLATYDLRFNSSNAIDRTHVKDSEPDWQFTVLRYTWDTIAFPPVGRWHLLLVADETVTPPVDRTVNASFWSVDVELDTFACPESACSRHGTCEMKQTYRGLSYGACSCHYGFGGEQCQLRTVEAKFRKHQIFLLIFSNIAILPVTLLSCRRKLYIDSVLFGATGLVSAIYHACDVELVCILPYRFLHQMDFALSFNMIMLLSVHLSGARKQAKAGVQAVLFLATIVMANRATSMTNWVLIGAGCSLQFSVTLVYYFVMGSQRMGLGKLAALKSFLFHSNNFDMRYGILGLGLWIGALSCWFSSSSTNYWLIHSLWHMLAMLSAFCFIGLRRNDRYKMIVPETGEDVLRPNYESTKGAVALKVVELEPPKAVSVVSEAETVADEEV
ncbi:hypothetical protein P43SY_002047 [Pythium insidiosum]|uniref:EGF-like domain-containing protein n=1 Tax=Pythium insidiosum TaxID=114742 RepID=A0AAD5M630_PYTIN|nr:hypothetical protein P43SY_002047 [Pythium insidiosum]